MPPSGFNQQAVKGALEFIKGCYEDLRAEVKSGKHPSMEAAVEHELAQLEKALATIHINDSGELVERTI